MERAVSLLEAGGRSVTVDRPYSGALVPATFYGKEPNVSALMIEVNRRLTMDEASGVKREGFGEIAELVRRVVMALFEKLLGD